MCIVFLPLKNRAITFCSGILMNRNGGLGVAFHDSSITFCYSVVSHLQKGVDLLDGVTFCYSMVLRRRTFLGINTPVQKSM